MQKNIILAGVGGQGILSIAFILVNAALKQGLNVKQSEVHGMSQRGGPVYCHVRISDQTIYSDLIPEGKADLIISVEPVEAYRYAGYLSPEGTIITSSVPYKDAGYNLEKVLSLISNIKNSRVLDAEEIAKKAGSPKAQNVVMVGAASDKLELDEENIKGAIARLFGRKKPKLVDMNLKAFELGKQA